MSATRPYHVKPNTCKCHPETCNCARFVLLFGEQVVAQGAHYLPLNTLAARANNGLEAGSSGERMSKRGTGRTTAQMQAAPRDVVYVVGQHREIPYARALAYHLGRADLRIVSFEWVRNNPPLVSRGCAVLDHAASEFMTARDFDLWDAVKP